ncbi:DUF3344 domain-containing protein [Streptomyces sp. PR69]|uniref:DUF3344 domain-containing protein n=1 Tax=Streptomyces sp. PR69 TaxID=2984950 RepID=UPI002264D9D0|nr:DUF3344 domain-containing protein [Streptomyces sp. PR69]
MPKSTGAPGSAGLAARGALGALLLLALCAVRVTAAPADAAGAAASAERIPFTQRYHAVHHGGIVRAANSAITCTSPVRPAVGKAASCQEVKRGAAGVNGGFEMFYNDLDSDPNTYNSTRAELVLPEGSTVRYARLYWGGNLRVSEQKPPEDNGRALIAEPGGRYKEVLADTRVAHRDADGADAYHASADITPLVRQSGAGLYTVAQVNVAKGNTAVGAWGGWTLVVVYENEREPLRHLALWDGFERLDADRPAQTVTLRGLRVPAKAAGRAGVIGYDGDRGAHGDSMTVRAGGGAPYAVKDGVNPADDIMNSTIADSGRAAAFERRPAQQNTLGYDSDVFDIRPALSRGGAELAFRFTAESKGYFLGALFVETDSRL